MKHLLKEYDRVTVGRALGTVGIAYRRKPERSEG
jgi:hypothetical protein